MKKTIAAGLGALILALCGSPVVTAPAASAGFAAKHDARRLPPGVVPIAYKISVHPDLTTGVFNGDETIEINVAEPGADRILLHSKDLQVEAPSLQRQDDKGGKTPLLATTFHAYPADAMIEFKPERRLAAGKYRLRLTFSGKLSNKLVGFYRSTFKDAAGKEHALACTQFEPADARRMFPCFDEPDFKATFKLSVRAKKGLTAIANAPVERHSENKDGTTTFDFEATPPMSSYLVALVVGEMQPTKTVEAENIPITVWSVVGKQHLGDYSRDEAAKILPVLTKYFGIPYPWKKLDLIAIPDFEAGAMENPGAITFRETLLLIDPATASSHGKRASTSVIAHEMAHLWFGDLVTMKWWDDLWLNEAFATWMATKAVDAVHPDWEEWKDYAGDRLHSMRTDGLASTRAIHSKVTDPETAHEMFDEITYDKGSAILRMIERYVTEPVFQKGVHDYLEKHAYGNATTGDLWAAVATASGAPVAEIMYGWVNQPGYPLLSLSPAEHGSYSVKQRRFFETGVRENDQSEWKVPIGVRTVAAGSVGDDAQQQQLLATREGTIAETGNAGSGTLWANAGGVGYYRTKYPPGAYEKLAGLAQRSMGPAERLALLDDAWALAKVGDISIDEYLNLVSSFKSDKDELVAEEIINQLEYLHRFINPGQEKNFERFVQAQLTPLFQTLGWQAKPSETQQIRMLRGSMLSTLGTIGQDQAVIATARQYFDKLAQGKPGSNAGIDADLMRPITEIVAYNGSGKDFEFFKTRSKTATTPEEEHRNLFALSAFKAPNLVQQVMTMSINGTVRTQDAPRLLSGLLSRPDTNIRTWEFIENNWKKLTEFYPEEMVPHTVSSASSFNSPEQFDRFKTFVSTHRIPSGESAVARTLERIQINVGFRKRSAARLNDWLKERYGA
jgi:puromycin-sensitive aminopeptidase